MKKFRFDSLKIPPQLLSIQRVINAFNNALLHCYKNLKEYLLLQKYLYVFSTCFSPYGKKIRIPMNYLIKRIFIRNI